MLLFPYQNLIFQYPETGSTIWSMLDFLTKRVTWALTKVSTQDITFRILITRKTEEGRTPRNAEEKFNKTYSSCRNIIERTFGVWKSRFHILEKMTRYKFETQADIVIATMVVHNYLRNVDYVDYAFTRVANVRHCDEQGDIEIEENK
ncbi:Uncharacterized protein Adt_34102 [Abeliophyllum distichum]|uniref:DDE Tnp4 domain-containing protein n=1 Tax=Abeliophyllum distichum TaxID=126358 RepID=A0ABD1R0N5_9LAMI